MKLRYSKDGCNVRSFARNGIEANAWATQEDHEPGACRETEVGKRVSMTR